MEATSIKKSTRTTFGRMCVEVDKQLYWFEQKADGIHVRKRYAQSGARTISFATLVRLAGALETCKPAPSNYFKP